MEVTLAINDPLTSSGRLGEIGGIAVERFANARDFHDEQGRVIILSA